MDDEGSEARARRVDATNAARKEIERNHADIVQLSLEKVRLAHIALEMIQYNIRDLDAELVPFSEEMKQRNEAGFDDEFAVDGVDGVDPTGFGDFDHGANSVSYTHLTLPTILLV